MLRRRLPSRPSPLDVVVVAATVSVVVFAHAGCGDGAAREPVTLIVDADRARADEDRARLVEMRSGVQQDRAALDKTRQDLSELRARLEKTLSSDDVVRLQASERALQERASCGAGAAPDPAALEAVVRRVVDEELARHEERLRAAIASDLQAAVSGRAPSTTNATARVAGSEASAGATRVTPTRDDVRSKYGLVRERLRARDVVGPARTRIDALLDEAMTKLKGNDLAAADRLLDDALGAIGP